MNTHSQLLHTALVLTTAIAPLCLTLGYPTHTHAQDMNFDAEEVVLRTHIALVETQKVRRKTSLQVIKTLEKRIKEYGGYEIIPTKSLRKKLGYKGFRTLKTCKTPDCFYPVAQEAELDRVLLVKLFKQDGLLTIDLSIHNPFKSKEVAKTAIYTKSLRTQNWDETIETLLSLKKELPPPQAPPDPEPIVIDNTPPPDDSLSPIWAYSLVGAGVLTVGLGAFFGTQASSTRDDLQASPQPRANVDALIQEGEDNALYANVSYGLGTLLIGAGVTLYLFSTPPAETQRASTSSSPTDSSQTISLDPLQDGFLLRFSSPL